MLESPRVLGERAELPLNPPPPKALLLDPNPEPDETLRFPILFPPPPRFVGIAAAPLPARLAPAPPPGRLPTLRFPAPTPAPGRLLAPIFCAPPPAPPPSPGPPPQLATPPAEPCHRTYLRFVYSHRAHFPGVAGCAATRCPG